MKADAQILDKKIELIQWLFSLDDKTIIEKLIQFRKTETKDLTFVGVPFFEVIY